MFEGLSSMLGEYPDFNVIGVATTVKDAVEKAVLLKPDLVLMDYRLPDGDGRLLAAQIVELFAAAPKDEGIAAFEADDEMT